MKQVILFTAPWCDPCKAFKPIFNEVSKEFPQIEFKVLDVSQEQGTAQRFKVMSVPTLIVITDGYVSQRVTAPSTRENILMAIREE